MSIFEKHRFKIINQSQHPFVHNLSDFGFNDERIPGVTTLEDTLIAIVAAIWPNYKGTVATPANLPLIANLNDYYIVTNDGDGKSAGYVYQKIDNVEQWIKRYDWDWSSDGILAEAINSVSPYYVHKWGFCDRDEDGVLFAGDLAGQRIYGGENANEHLILYANSGDALGNTGFVQFGDNVRPLLDSNFILGDNLYRFLNFYTDEINCGTLKLTTNTITDSTGDIDFDNENLSTTGDFEATNITALTNLTVDTLQIITGSITDSTGAIDFDNENLSTTGTLESGQITISSDIVIDIGSITSVSGDIDFDNENLITTGTLEAGDATLTKLDLDDFQIDFNLITIKTVDTDLQLSANGTGVIDVLSNMETLDITSLGILTVIGQFNADDLRIDGNTLSSTAIDSDIDIDPNGTGSIKIYASILLSQDNLFDFGNISERIANIYIGTSISDGTDSILISEILGLRNVFFRDAARTLPAQAGDTLFYDNVSGTYLANHPDTEIEHSEIHGLTTGDAGHTQFAMLAGRNLGQVIQGGINASENLDLESTSHITKGLIRTKDNFVPYTNASYSGSWSGIDLGDTSHYFKDIYLKGEAKGFRGENFTSLTIPASSAANKGRLIYLTDEEKYYVDTGIQFVAVGGTNKFVSDISFDGIVTVKNVDVSSEITDARNAIFNLLDNNNNFEKMFVKMEATSASNIRITTNLPLPAASYRIIVME